MRQINFISHVTVIPIGVIFTYLHSMHSLDSPMIFTLEFAAADAQGRWSSPGQCVHAPLMPEVKFYTSQEPRALISKLGTTCTFYCNYVM